MKKLLLVIPLLLLTACGGSTEAVNGQEQYVKAVRDAGGKTAEGMQDVSLIELGYIACLEYARGKTPTEFTDELLSVSENTRTEFETFVQVTLLSAEKYLCAGVVDEAKN